MNYLNIKGYDDRYRVYEDGTIKSYKILKKTKKKRCFEMKTFLNNKGYKYICLTKNNKRKWELIHRLVARHFIPNPENKPHINHKDGNPKNNHISNLEWVTQSENLLHAYQNKLRLSKIKEDQVPAIRNDPRSLQKIADDYGVTRHTIWHIKKRNTFKYID